MSLLDDARALPTRRIHEYRGDGNYSCVLCGWAATREELDQPAMEIVHATDCPWLSIPGIAALVELAYEISDDVEAYPLFDNRNRTKVDVHLVNSLHDLTGKDHL